MISKITKPTILLFLATLCFLGTFGMDISDINKLALLEETPMHKIEKRLEKYIQEEASEEIKPQFAVVLTTGAMNPVHKCHIRMLELAKTELENNNWIVLGGFISATHDSYVSSKGTEYIPGVYRKEMIVRAVKNHDFICLDNWEIDLSHFVNYDEVAAQLGKTLKKKFNDIPITVFYVMGGDRAFFAKDIVGLGDKFGAVVVKRNKDEPYINPKLVERFNGRHFVIDDDETRAKDMSSTDIRARIQNGEDISDLVPQEVADYMQNNLVLRTKY